jgi:hypothetical protein
MVPVGEPLGTERIAGVWSGHTIPKLARHRPHRVAGATTEGLSGARFGYNSAIASATSAQRKHRLS